MRGMARIVVLAFLALGCDSGPSGPGTLTGSIQSPVPTLGGAVLEVVGKGITGFSGAGQTHVFWAPTAVEATYRVVLVAQNPGQLQFQVAMEDKGAGKPEAAVVNLVTGDNLPIPATSQYRVVFTR